MGGFARFDGRERCLCTGAVTQSGDGAWCRKKVMERTWSNNARGGGRGASPCAVGSSDAHVVGVPVGEVGNRARR